MPLFGKKKEKPLEKVKRWKREIKKQERQIDRAINDIEREDLKIKIKIKQYAKKGEESTAKLLARDLVKSRASKHRLMKNKSQIQAIHRQLTEQETTLKSGVIMKKSTKMMIGMSQLANCTMGSVSMAAQAMQKEMQKAGMLADLVDDAMEDDEIDDLSDEADAAVDKIYDDIMLNTMGTAAPSSASPLGGADKDLEARRLALGS
eukprot:TRINITY_DN6986_c0_g1_i2.p1 TRINITY_DN6986_c0_g1~~TRINITY_DN6986_c0_g1_i2.p1  ORF type:complete len:205 (-),score=56.14 TRINITY_DN6986_c0_g1_i2:77-691(-)